MRGDLFLEAVREAVRPVELGQIGPYEVIREIGRGGQGIVYEATDSRTGGRVALKRLLSGPLASPRARHRFEREMDAIATLDHPLIVRTRGIEQVGEHPILVMDWIDGVSLTCWMGSAERSIPDDLRLFVLLADALRHAHRRGVIHRDLKPENVLVDAKGEPHLLDFGLAKWSDLETDSISRTSEFLGTPAFAAPEQVRGVRGAVDVRSDIYSLGVIFYLVLTAEMPYPVDGGMLATMGHIAETPARRLRLLRREIPKDLEAIVLRMLEKDPEDRYGSMDLVREELGRVFRGEPVEAKGHTNSYILRMLVHRHRVPLVGASLLLAVVTTFAVAMTWLHDRAEHEAQKVAQVEEFLGSILASHGAVSDEERFSVRRLLENASSRLENEFSDVPEVRARVHTRLARSYGSFWLWPEAARHAAASLAIYEALPGDHEVEIAGALRALGLAQTFLGNAEAEHFIRRAISIQERRLDPGHVDQATAHAFLAFALWRVAEPPDVEAAEAHYETAFAIFDRQPDAPTLAHAGSMYAYAALAAEEGRAEESDRRYRRALALYEEVAPGNSRAPLRCREDHARVLAWSGRSEEAWARLDEAWANSQPSARQVEILVILAEIQRRHRQPGAARKSSQKALGIASKLVGSHNPAAAQALSRLGEEGSTTARLEDSEFARKWIAAERAAARPGQTSHAEWGLGSAIRSGWMESGGGGEAKITRSLLENVGTALDAVGEVSLSAEAGPGSPPRS